MERFVGLSNFTFLFKRETFWMVVRQSCIFAITAVVFKALIGFIVAHFVHNIPGKKQRKWRGMLLVPWVIPPAMSTLAWLWLFDPSYSAFNYSLSYLGIGPIPWLGDTFWARFSVILVNVWYGAPFFMIMYLAALKSVPDQLYEAASIDGANWWQKIWHITLPMMRNIIAITTLFSLIVTFANFDIVRILTSGGPLDTTHLFATWAFQVGTMNSETQAPSGMSLLWMPTWNAQVANRCVVSSGPPDVRMRTMSKLAKVTIREKRVVIAMMLRIIGKVMCQIFCHQLAPSIAAAS